MRRYGRLRGCYFSCLEDFLFAVREGKPPFATAFDGRQATAALEAIHRSLETGNAEDVAGPPPELQAVYALKEDKQ